MHRFCALVAMLMAGLVGIAAAAGPASAKPQSLDCLLTDTGTRPGSENRAITIAFDDDAKSLSAQDGGQNYTFGSVSITNVVINGGNDSVSVGIDRSSFGIVWQKYDSTGVAIEYGKCRPSAHPAAASAH